MRPHPEFSRTKTKVRDATAAFELGKEFREHTVDDRYVQSTFQILEEDTNEKIEGKLVRCRTLRQRQTTAKGIVAVIDRIVSVDEDEDSGKDVMTVSMCCNDVKSSALFKRL